MHELSARERVILAIDTSSEQEAERLAEVAREAGARFVKLGLGLSTATSWRYCSELAAENGLDWVADAKLDDISNTVGDAVDGVKDIAALEHRPFGITMHTTAGKESMRVAQEKAGDIMMLGVTILTSIDVREAAELYGTGVTVEDIVTLYKRIVNLNLDDQKDLQWQQATIDGYFQEKTQNEETAKQAVSDKVLELARNAASVGLKGIVASPHEVGRIKQDPATKNLFAMIPGIRPAAADVQDQSRPGTPAAAIAAGADLLVIGRPITQAPDPAEAYEAIVAEIMGVTK